LGEVGRGSKIYEHRQFRNFANFKKTPSEPPPILKGKNGGGKMWLLPKIPFFGIWGRLGGGLYATHYDKINSPSI
jgi:hypothetical protein